MTVHWTLLPNPNCVDKFAMACDNFSLTIGTKKTEVTHQPAPGKPYVEINITIKEQRLKVVEKFTDFSSTLSVSIIMDDDVNTRLTNVTAAFFRLSRNVWNWTGISEATKINVYLPVVLTTLLYDYETWTPYQLPIKKLNHFNTTWLRRILAITWQKPIPTLKF